MCHRRATLSHVCRSLVERLWHCSVMVEIAAKVFLLFKLLGASCPFFFDWYLLINTLWLHSHLRTTTHIIIRKYLLLSGPFDHAFGHGKLSLQTCINGFEDESGEVGIIMKKSNIDIQSSLLSLLFFLEFVNAVLERSLRQNLIRVLFIFVLLFWNSWGDWFNRGGGSGRSV